MIASPDCTTAKMWENITDRYSTGSVVRCLVCCFSPLCALRKGYEAASKYFEPQDLDVSVVGRSFMITGANSGIGRATAMAIAKKGK